MINVFTVYFMYIIIIFKHIFLWQVFIFSNQCNDASASEMIYL